jgi:hypothetical protein
MSVGLPCSELTYDVQGGKSTLYFSIKSGYFSVGRQCNGGLRGTFLLGVQRFRIWIAFLGSHIRK